MPNEKAHLTAITRRALSLPTKFLQQAGLLVGHVLDYGCGRGFDCDALGCDGYDPHWRPARPAASYDTIYCNYVLNVIPDASERQDVLWDIQRLLGRGKAYISVRNDKFTDGLSSKGTWQGHIKLNLPVVKKNSNFIMYELCKGDCLADVETNEKETNKDEIKAK
jgi:hypothetical protein